MSQTIHRRVPGRGGSGQAGTEAAWRLVNTKGKPAKIKDFCEETGRRVLNGSTEGSRYGWVGDCEQEVYCWLKKRENICSFGML